MWSAQSAPLMTGIQSIVLAMDAAFASPEKKNANPLMAGNVSINPAAAGSTAAAATIPA